LTRASMPANNFCRISIIFLLIFFSIVYFGTNKSKKLVDVEADEIIQQQPSSSAIIGEYVKEVTTTTQAKRARDSITATSSHIGCDSPSDFSLKLYNELKLNNPEKLFYLAELTDMGFDGKFHGRRYQGEIKPLDDFKCQCGDSTSFADVCSPHSFFDVLISGPVLTAVFPEYDTERAAYTFQFVIPVLGTYLLDANLTFFAYHNWSDFYPTKNHFKSKIKEPAFRAAFPNMTERPVVNGKGRKLDITPDKLNKGSKELASQTTRRDCAASDLKGPLPGFWDQHLSIWQPYQCNLPSKDLSPDVVGKILSGKWIMFLGDSNTRNLFRAVCRMANAKVELEQKKFVCMGKDFAITEIMYWPGDQPVKTILTSGFQLFVDYVHKAEYVIESPVMREKKSPDYIFVSGGSHAPNRAGSTVTDLIFSEWNEASPEILQDGKLGILFTTSSCVSKIPKREDLENMELIQNNVRVHSVNKAHIKQFQGQLPLFDFFSMTYPVSTSLRSVDALHFPQSIYDNQARMVYIFLASQS